MGNECCQQQNVGIYSIDISSKFRKDQFSLVQTPKDDRYLAQKMTQYNELRTDKVMKHLHLQKYYWGGWQQNAPMGDGFLYSPENYFYKGKFNLKPNDYGQIQFIKTGIIYKGQIVQGRAQGQGTLTHHNNLYYYQGLWKNSQPVTGTLIIKQSPESKVQTTVQFNQYPMQATKISYPDGRQYVGTVHRINLVPEGRGKVTYPDGTVYEGEWSEGQFHGEGIYTWPDGSFYEGSYQYGLKHGFGKYVFRSRNIYQGEWIKGLQHGRGTLFNQRGDVIKKGIWRQGKFLTTEEL